MKVAFATRTGERVDCELRGTPRLDVYDVGRAGIRLDRTCDLEQAAPGAGARIRALADVELVYVTAIGPSAAARLAAHGMRVATSWRGARVDALLAELQERLREAGRLAG